MIQRLVTTLRALAALPAPELGTPPGRQLAAECADAVRLALDCPQQDLTAWQRETLHALSDALEDERAPAADVVRAVREACGAVGIALAERSAPPA